ncbi:thioredoxin [Oceanobacillus iheyensis HTE831]|uniref:Small, acid-soluble spore protein Tlp n=1 Tax=Oceanobacillus iheyensis (strain DSM 14371 / CIP 107618 / JCM 11309 / KCTC 3954 / HTE831) TaxID=221109 RepID=TLP_OCEIH|nr:small acid-soluble spore protein Tlp [Oceanobacillus iheyensis]Q8ETS4.1 RecName: Full=Small, acid-soluble spore protein Tlp [Oceanobacillus iheyensis HTE831]BAC12138.1 thioredoxin [Oceanobacillus iheyensis HTE831]
MTHPKPDDRSDNVEKIQNTIDHTLENLNESKDYINAHAEELSSKEKDELSSKNERRKESVDGLRSEIKDEADSQ